MERDRDREVAAVLVAQTTDQVLLTERQIASSSPEVQKKIEDMMGLAHQLIGRINPKVLTRYAYPSSRFLMGTQN